MKEKSIFEDDTLYVQKSAVKFFGRFIYLNLGCENYSPILPMLFTKDNINPLITLKDYSVLSNLLMATLELSSIDHLMCTLFLKNEPLFELVHKSLKSKSMPRNYINCIMGDFSEILNTISSSSSPMQGAISTLFALVPNCIDSKSNSLAKNFLNHLSSYDSINSVALYCPVNNEVDTKAIHDELIYQNLNDLKLSATIGNPKITEFEDSVFTGKYCAGKISKEYLSELENNRASKE